MKLDEIVAWYQKKIGTYDKQQWEKTVEQKILNGFTSVTLKNATLKTEFIDVDLVRGSSFPKAKPKQSLITVIKLAILRYFFLPLYAKWWVSQTSPILFIGLLCIYTTQMINWAVYSFNIHRIDETDSEHIVSLSELLIPMALSLVLNLIHSQIVSTNTGNKTKSKRNKQQIYNNVNGKTRERVRRRRKVGRFRSYELNNKSSHVEIIETIQYNNNNNKYNKNISKLELQNSKELLTKNDLIIVNNNNSNSTNINDDEDDDDNVFCNKNNEQKLVINNYLNDLIDLSTQNIDTQNKSVQNNDDLLDINSSTSSSAAILRKRSVNWDSPIHNYACDNQNFGNFTTSSPIQKRYDKYLKIDESVQEFYDNLIQLTDDNIKMDKIHLENLIEPKINENCIEFVEQQTNGGGGGGNGGGGGAGDDDGFESLNGKSSSGEENHDRSIKIDKNDDMKSKNSTQIRLPYKNIRSINIKDCSEDDSCTVNDDASSLLLNHRNSLSTLSTYRRKIPLSSESDFERNLQSTNKKQLFEINRATTIISGGSSATTIAGCVAASSATTGSTSSILPENILHQKKLTTNETSDDTDEGDCDDDAETISSPNSITNPNYTECTTSATDWFGITTNSEECSYSSELDQSDFQNNISDDGLYHDYTPTVILNPSCGSNDRINCTIWDHHEVKKAEMSVLDISSCIIERVEAMPETCDYVYIGVVFSIILSMIPSFCRLCEATVDSENSPDVSYLEIPMLLWEKASFSFTTILRFAFGETGWERTILVIGFIQRLFLTSLLFFLFAVAERTFKQRFLYAKLFSHLTSSRRARKSDLPHFRLNKVRNIKTWLSVRSYLKRRGPQRSVEVIVSAAFIITLLLLAFLSVEWLKDSVHLHSQYNMEALLWSSALGIFLLRFMTLGNKINRKYRSISVLITEQINLYLQIEQKPKKKDELMVSNSVLKLAADLLKELESPFKISGLSANPYLYTTIKVVILSALSGVLSEMLGFKLKLHKIKIK